MNLYEAYFNYLWSVSIVTMCSVHDTMNNYWRGRK